jgi:hypothetical protein
MRRIASKIRLNDSTLLGAFVVAAVAYSLGLVWMSKP